MGERDYLFERLHKSWNNHPKVERQARLTQQPTLGPPMKLLHFEASMSCLKKLQKLARCECNIETE